MGCAGDAYRRLLIRTARSCGVRRRRARRLPSPRRSTRRRALPSDRHEDCLLLHQVRAADRKRGRSITFKTFMSRSGRVWRFDLENLLRSKATLAALSIIALGCSGVSLSGSADGAVEVGSPLDVGRESPLAVSGVGDHPPHAPANHRAAAPTSPCPAERGAGTTPGSCGGSVLAICAGDSDCTDGLNGRCLHGDVPIACGQSCSYDQCATDADCAGNGPCVCRTSASDSAANVCQGGGNCRIDADCGPGGDCSRSVLNDRCNGYRLVCDFNCGRGYFLATPRKDTCTDDSDCMGGICGFDLDSQLWRCGGGACSS